MRRRIYSYLESTVNDHLHLHDACIQYHSDNEDGRAASEALFEPPALHVYMVDLAPLEYVCRSLYQDICEIFYGQNRIIVSEKADLDESMNFALRLGPMPLRFMTSLTIILRRSGTMCPFGDRLGEDVGEGHSHTWNADMEDEDCGQCPAEDGPFQKLLSGDRKEDKAILKQ